jgi:hypothetical protein
MIAGIKCQTAAKKFLGMRSLLKKERLSARTAISVWNIGSGMLSLGESGQRGSSWKATNWKGPMGRPTSKGDLRLHQGQGEGHQDRADGAVQAPANRAGEPVCHPAALSTPQRTKGRRPGLHCALVMWPDLTKRFGNLICR